MKLLLIPIGLFVVCGVHGGPVEQAIMAAMRLSEQPNYAWSVMVADDARSYALEGKTQKGGYTWMRFPHIKAISSRLGREADNEIEAVFKGSAASVLRTESGWKTLAELPRARRMWNDDPFFWPTPAAMPISARGGRMGQGAFGALDPLDPGPIAWQLPALADDEEKRPYSNAQFGVSLPHDELAVIVSSFVDLQVAGNIVAGTLSDVGARLLLVRDGQEDQVQPLCAAGTFKLQIANGIVTKYIVRLEGIVLVDKKKVRVHQTSSTTVTNIGKSDFEVPDEVRRKLGG
jgi:hypothetical protein